MASPSVVDVLGDVPDLHPGRHAQEIDAALVRLHRRSCAPHASGEWVDAVQRDCAEIRKAVGALEAERTGAQLAVDILHEQMHAAQQDRDGLRVHLVNTQEENSALRAALDAAQGETRELRTRLAAGAQCLADGPCPGQPARRRVASTADRVPPASSR